MRTIGGGTVRHVGLAWIECPDEPGIVGECTKGGVVEVLWNGMPMETFDVRPGDQILVPDGATAVAGAWLFRHGGWSRRLRADIPAGVRAVVHWSEPLGGGPVDELTGLSRARFGEGEGDVGLALVLDGGLTKVSVPRDATPVVQEGEVVVRGQTLARLSFPRSREQLSGVSALRDFLDARVDPRRHTRALAPCDGRVEEIERKHVVIRAADGTRCVVRRGRSPTLLVREGAEVRAGDALDAGERDHHALLRIWGEARLAEHLVEELEVEMARRSLAVPRAYVALVVRSMLAWRRVVRPGDTGLRRHRVVSRRDFEAAQRETAARGGAPAVAVPALRGVAWMARRILDRARSARGKHALRGAYDGG